MNRRTLLSTTAAAMTVAAVPAKAITHNEALSQILYDMRNMNRRATGCETLDCAEAFADRIEQATGLTPKATPKDPLIDLGAWEQTLYDEYNRLWRIEEDMLDADKRLSKTPSVIWKDRCLPSQSKTYTAVEDIEKDMQAMARLTFGLNRDGSLNPKTPHTTAAYKEGRKLIAKLKAKIAAKERLLHDSGYKQALAAADEAGDRHTALEAEILAIEPRSVEGSLVHLRILKRYEHEELENAKLDRVIAGLEKLANYG